MRDMIERDPWNNTDYEPLLRLSYRAGRITAKTVMFLMDCINPNSSTHRRKTRKKLPERRALQKTFTGQDRRSKASSTLPPDMQTASPIESRAGVETDGIIPEIHPVIHVKAAELNAEFQDLTEDRGDYLLIFVTPPKGLRRSPGPDRIRCRGQRIRSPVHNG